MLNASALDFFYDTTRQRERYSDKAHLIAYSYDATRERFEPEAVLFPRHEQDVSDILKYCNEHKIVIVPRGAGSGFTGGALPANGGIVLAFEKHMNKILNRYAKYGCRRSARSHQQRAPKAVEEVGLSIRPIRISGVFDDRRKCQRKCGGYACGKIRHHQRLRHGNPCGAP